MARLARSDEYGDTDQIGETHTAPFHHQEGDETLELHATLRQSPCAQPVIDPGHYVILEELGRGGMGVVHAGYDRKLDRKVAIKLLHTGCSEQMRHRLLREAKALAKLSHPNVVQIYEVGEAGAFIVMEYVAGATLRQWLRHSPRSVTEILAAFRGAGRGLAAAHAQNLVHRDFKPDNVMIRDDGRALVMDFGLARGEFRPSMPELSLDDVAVGGPTQTRTVLGTPAYMAPEQFEGAKVSVEADQFAFCVALWEALYGARPYAGTTLSDLLEAIRAGRLHEPEPGRREVPRWLREVLARGLATEPAARWPSMDALLAALAHDPSRTRRVWLAVSATALALTATLAGAQAMEARERSATLASCERAGQAIASDWAQHDELEQAFAAANPELGPEAWTRTWAWIEATTEAWSALRTRACVETRVEGTRSVDSLARVNACLDDRRAALAVLRDAWAQPDARTILRAPEAVTGLTPVALCGDANWLAQRLPEPDIDAAALARVRAQLERAESLELAGEHQAGLALAEQALIEARALGWRPLVAEAQLEIARLHTNLADYPAAQQAAREAVAEGLGGAHDIIALDAASLLAFIVGYRLGEIEEGMYWAQLATMLVERAGLRGTTHEATLFNNIGNIQGKRGDYVLALEYHRQARALREAALGPEHPDTAGSINHVGRLLIKQDKLDEALIELEEAARVWRSSLGPRHPFLGYPLTNIGKIHAKRGQVDRALAAHREALAVREAALGPEHPSVASSLYYIGKLQLAEGQLEQATDALRRAARIRAAKLGPDSRAHGLTLGLLGRALAERGRDDEATEVLERAVAILGASVNAEQALEDARAALDRLPARP